MDEKMAALVRRMVQILDREGWVRCDIIAALDVAEAMIDDYYDELAKEESGRHPS
jgi:hypothetical protein